MKQTILVDGKKVEVVRLLDERGELMGLCGDEETFCTHAKPKQDENSVEVAVCDIFNESLDYYDGYILCITCLEAKVVETEQ